MFLSVWVNVVIQIWFNEYFIKSHYYISVLNKVESRLSETVSVDAGSDNRFLE